MRKSSSSHRRRGASDIIHLENLRGATTPWIPFGPRFARTSLEKCPLYLDRYDQYGLVPRPIDIISPRRIVSSPLSTDRGQLGGARNRARKRRSPRRRSCVHKSCVRLQNLQGCQKGPGPTLLVSGVYTLGLINSFCLCNNALISNPTPPCVCKTKCGWCRHVKKGQMYI